MSFKTADRLYRKPITVGTASGTVTGFQKKITVTYNSRIANDFSDLIFEDSSDNNLPYWIETQTNGITASVWVKLNTSTSSSSTIYMYYGSKTTETSESNIDTTMDTGLRAFLYDGTAFNTYTGNTIDTNPNHDWGSGTVSINGISIGSDTCSIYWKGWVKPYGTGNTVFYGSSDDGQRLYVGGSLIIDNWVDQGTTERSGSYNLTTIKTIQYNWYENGGGAVAKLGWDPVSGGKTYPISSSYVRSSKYLSTEPSITFGDEENRYTNNFFMFL